MSYDWLIEAGKIAGAVSVIVATVIMLFKYVIVKPLQNFIEDVITEKTYPIQKDSNGGNSLPDVSKKLNNVEKRINTLEDSHKEIITNQEQILDILTRPPRRGRPPKQES